MMLQAAPPAVVAPSPSVEKPQFDRRITNLVALIAKGPAVERDRLSAMAQAQGFVARHAVGPKGDELMVIFSPAEQRKALVFADWVEKVFAGRLFFERAMLPPERN